MSARSTSTFTIFPALDLRGGRVVRLAQGDFDREQAYGDPLEVVASFAAAGPAWIHVVDLDGARAGERRQADAIAAIRRAVPFTVRLQVGGGLRSAAAVAETLDAGADRAVLGTAALRDPALLAAAIDRHGSDRIAVALDVRDGLAVGEAWVAGAAGIPVDDAVRGATTAGATVLIVTAIDRDGLLGGPDLALFERLIGRTDAAIVASGGIASIDDLEAVRAIGCAGAIVGRALYDGRIDLGRALAAFA